MLLTAFLLVRHSMRRGLIYLILCSLLTACMGSQMRQELHRVDSLNRCDVPLDTITTMPDVVDYFDTWGSANERMKAHYLLARTYADKGHAPHALDEFHHAAEQADTTLSDCDFKTLARVYGQMGDLFYNYQLPHNALSAYQTAYHYSRRAGEATIAPLFYAQQNNCYYSLSLPDSSIYILKNTINMLMACGDTLTANTYKGPLFYVLAQKNDFTKAEEYIDAYENHSLINEGALQNSDNYKLLYIYKGLFYQYKANSDSALYYYYKAIHTSQTPNNRTLAYHGLYQTYDMLHMHDSVSKYSILYAETNDETTKLALSSSLLSMQHLYNYHHYELLAEQKSKENAYYKRLIIASIAVFLLLAYFAYRYVRALQRRKRNELMAANTEYSSLLLQYSKLQKDLSLSESGISQYRQAKEKEIQELQQKLALYLEAPQIAEHWNIEQAMLNSPIVTGLHEQASHVKILSAVQWKELREFVEQELPDFYQNINHRDGGLSPREVLVCILIRLQFSQGELSALLGVSKQRINNIKRNINQKLFKEEGAQTLDNHIFSI